MALIRKTRSAEEPHALHAVPAGVSRTVARDADAQRKRARTLAKQQQASERVASASSELSAGINEAASAAEELKRAATQIATGAEEASGAAQESLAAVTQVGGAITRQLAAVNQAQHMADGMRKLAGNEVVPYLVELSNNMNEGMDTITTDIIDALGHMQFQDINRQLLEQVESALGNLSEHSAALYALVGGDAPPPPQALEELMERWIDGYVMEEQRVAHAEVTRQPGGARQSAEQARLARSQIKPEDIQLAEPEVPKIELF